MSDVNLWDAQEEEEDPTARTKRIVEYRMGKLLDRFRTLHAPISNSAAYPLTPQQFSKMIKTVEEQLAMLKALGEKRYGSAAKFQL
jgi:hypothetical protein